MEQQEQEDLTIPQIQEILGDLSVKYPSFIFPEEVFELLGMGTYAQVWSQPSGCFVIKIARRGLSRSSSHTEDLSQSLRELMVLRHSTHPNLLKCHTSWHHWSTGRVVFLLDRWPMTLETWVLLSPLPERTHSWRDLAIQLFAGLSHLHTMGFMHRDLTPFNVLIRRTASSPHTCGPWQVCLADLGLTRPLSSLPIYPPDRWRPSGSPLDSVTFPVTYSQDAFSFPFQPPELFLCLNGHPRYSESADVWSMGMILCYIIAQNWNSGPFGKSVTPAQLIGAWSPFISLPISFPLLLTPPSLSRLIADLNPFLLNDVCFNHVLEQCLVVDPTVRASSYSILNTLRLGGWITVSSGSCESPFPSPSCYRLIYRNWFHSHSFLFLETARFIMGALSVDPASSSLVSLSPQSWLGGVILFLEILNTPSWPSHQTPFCDTWILCLFVTHMIFDHMLLPPSNFVSLFALLGGAAEKEQEGLYSLFLRDENFPLLTAQCWQLCNDFPIRNPHHLFPSLQQISLGDAGSLPGLWMHYLNFVLAEFPDPAFYSSPCPISLSGEEFCLPLETLPFSPSSTCIQ